jgi:hypothetical protein
MMPLEGNQASRSTAMSHDLIFALVFIIMIAAPALITTTSDRDERDPL